MRNKKLKIIIDIGHPAHVHLFKNFAWKMLNTGNEILFTVRNKESELYLLQYYGFNFRRIGGHGSSSIWKVINLLKSNFCLLLFAYRFKPDIFLSHGSICAAHVSWILRKPHITFEDTGNNEQVRLYLPFTKVVLTSTAFHKNYGNKQLKYNSYHELAYLHPKYFTVDHNFKKKLNIRDIEKYVILRFVSWNASHDIGEQGLSYDQKISLVREVSKYARVYISSEEELPLSLERLKYPLTPETIHQALGNADLFVGEGATMASECAMLGTPAIYINSINAGTIDEQEKLGLLFHYRTFTGVVEKSLEILLYPGGKEKFQKNRNQMLSEKINVTDFLIWFVENWPGSLSDLKNHTKVTPEFK